MSTRRRPGLGRRALLSVAGVVLAVAVWFVAGPQLTAIGWVGKGDCARVDENGRGVPPRLVEADCEGADGHLTYTVTDTNMSAQVAHSLCPGADVGWFEKNYPRPGRAPDPQARARFACLAPNLEVDRCYRASGELPDEVDSYWARPTCDERGVGYLRVVSQDDRAGGRCEEGQIALSFPVPGRTYCVELQEG
ncbi:hypothetical protein [Ornithinimicrobium tianjinense]|uniref:Uncharacterized protein n=1 Tax=Ornithinimicrobium tianjinense TaxID=1195761 RepID=A0A917F9Q2_9MICO|nr:hypothetical protein [Ornithinimicrobium tianjinense]GGF55915.1 hypothetical protein GCM10011366_24780 [Ornithinimicrobium tianjinense]